MYIHRCELFRNVGTLLHTENKGQSVQLSTHILHQPPPIPKKKKPNAFLGRWWHMSGLVVHLHKDRCTVTRVSYCELF